MLQNLNKFEKGQTLVEVLIVLVVAAIMIIALTMVILSSLKNAQYGENQIKATKYAQDALDKIKMMRDINTKTLQNPSKVICFNQLWSSDSNEGIVCTANPPNNNECYFKFNTDNSILVQQGNLEASKDSLGEGFTRYIMMSGQNASLGEITLTARVVWFDSSGAHESKVQTILIKPNYDCQTSL